MGPYGPHWSDDFPLTDEVEDYSGRTRTFIIDCHEVPLGFTVHAQEEGKDGLGYEFAAYSETSPYAALGRVRRKMHRALATRHITRLDNGYSMLHDEVRGRITWDQETGVALIVDGIRLSLEDLGSILSSHEGWSFELKIVDSLE